MVAFVHSPTYGMTVALGPTQELVYRYAWGMTAGGRRPEVTLARIAADLRKPVSSVHAALGRLRALGVLGVASRMGRTGATRLWRAAAGSAMSVRLDVARHRRAVARIIATWRHARPVRSDVTQADPVRPPVPASGADGESPLPSPTSGRSFREAMTRAGFRAWWEEDGDARHPEPDTDNADGPGRADLTLGLYVAPAGRGGQYLHPGRGSDR